MRDDELTGGIEGWAAATDPDSDPITADEILDAPVTEVRRDPRPRRGLAVAAALVVVAGLAGAVAVGVIGPDDDASDVATEADDGPGTAPSTQIVVDAPDLGSAWWHTVHRLALLGPCPGGGSACATSGVATAVAEPLEPGTSLAVDQPLTAGRWVVRIETYECEATAAGYCGEPRSDGLPSLEVDPAGTCDVGLDVPDRGGRFVIDVDVASGGDPACSVVDEATPVPALTIPPAWSLRTDLPWSCGAAAWDLNGQVTGDGDGAVDALDCFEQAVLDGTPMEMPIPDATTEPGLHRRWWRVLADPVDGKAVEVIRDRREAGGWTRAYCEDVEVGPTISEEGEVVVGRDVWAYLVECTDEEALPLDLPPLDEAALVTTSTTIGEATTTAEPATTAPPTTTGPPPAPGTVDVVLEVDQLPRFVEGGTHRWVVAVDGDDVAAGPLTEIGAWPGEGDGEWADVQQVADDLPVPDGAAVTVRVEDYDCSTWGPGCRADGAGPRPGTAAVDECVTEAPAERTGTALVATFRGDACTSTWADGDVPSLTVPPAYTLRPPSEGCATVGPDGRWAQCLLDTLTGGDGAAEWSVQYDGLRMTYLVDDGTLTVFAWVDAQGEPWTMQTCTGLDPDSRGTALLPVGCGTETTLPLTLS